MVKQFLEVSDDAIVDIIQGGIDKMEAGAEVVELSFDHLDLCLPTFYLINYVEFFQQLVNTMEENTVTKSKTYPVKKCSEELILEHTSVRKRYNDKYYKSTSSKVYYQKRNN